MSKILRNSGDPFVVHLPRCQNKSVIVAKRDGDELNLSPRRAKVPSRIGNNNDRVKWNTVPSPASGISEECLAMANACNHDHDYIVMPLSKSKEFDDDKDASIITLNNVSSESMPIIKAEFIGKTNFVPKPPPSNTSLEKAARRQSLRRSTKNAPRITKLFFTSDSKTAYRPPKQQQSMEQRENLASKTETHKDAAKTTHPSKNCSNNNNNNQTGIIVSESESEEDLIFLPTKHSSPNINAVLSPRPSITPMPPSDHRRCAASVRSRRHIQRHYEGESDVDSEVGRSNDSAYSSLSCSASSHPRTPSGGRPQSGDKRSATSNLSSSSSSFSSTDDDSDGDLKNDNVIQKLNGEIKVEPSEREVDQEFKPHIPKIVTKKSHKKVVKLHSFDNHEHSPIDHQKFMPTPPTRKQKKGGRSHEPLPMRLRALPTSFWQEPNKVNAVSYSVLPPVQLFKPTDLMDDVTDIRPITPPDEPEISPKILPFSPKNNALALCKTHPKVVIKTGDTDLLLRLFDKVESKNSNKTKSNPHRVKRGRPRRANRCAIPPPRLTFNEDPCIIDSITEKLFPKLSLEHRKRSTTSRLNDASEEDNFAYGITVPSGGSKFSDEFDFNINDNFEDCFSPNFLDPNEGFESLSTPNVVTNQRSVSVSFPQLSNAGPDLSQILSELAAGL